MPAQDPLSQVFSALADPLRRDVVVRLTAGDLTVRELAEPYDVTPQSVSKHLRVLEAAGLVSRRREAQRRPVHLEAEVFDLMTMWIERNRREAEFRYRRLDDVLLAAEAPAPVVEQAPEAVETVVERHGPARVDRLVVEERDTEPRTLRVRRGRDRVFQPWDLQSRVLPGADVEDDGADAAGTGAGDGAGPSSGS